ncbi:hypothetical protein D3C72_1953220 [compost metagenome]
MGKEAEVVANLCLGYHHRTTSLLHAHQHRGQVVATIEVHHRPVLRRRAALTLHDGTAHGSGVGRQHAHRRRAHLHGRNGDAQNRFVEGFGAGEVGHGDLEPVQCVGHGVSLGVG